MSGAMRGENVRKTALGRCLDEIRTRIKASGQPLLSWEDIDRRIDGRVDEALKSQEYATYTDEALGVYFARRNNMESDAR